MVLALPVFPEPANGPTKASVTEVCRYPPQLEMLWWDAWQALATIRQLWFWTGGVNLTPAKLAIRWAIVYLSGSREFARAVVF